MDPNVIEEYLRQQSQRKGGMRNPPEKNDKGIESEDDPEELNSVFSSSIRPIASSNNASTPTALRVVSNTSAPRPMPRTVPQALASSPPQVATRFASVRSSSPPEALSSTRGSSPPRSSTRFSSPEPFDVAKPEGPPFKALYQPGNKPAVSDYSLDAQPIIQMVINEYEVRISTVNAFPNEKKSLEWMRSIWADVMESQDENWVLTEHLRRLIRSRGSRMRGQAIKNARQVVQSHYSFSTIGNGAAIAKNRRLCEMLLMKSAFHYKNPSEHKGYGQNTIISNILHETWYRQGNADGVVFDRYFNPLPLECLALIFTALSFSIEEWSTGSRKQASFTETVAEAKYRAHLNDLELWNGLNPDVTIKIRKKLCQRARRYAGVIDDDPVAPQLVGDLIESARKELEGRLGETDTEGESEVEPEGTV
ncbi:hypothetical protein BDQ17DRAFT_1547031 [Cyathus striatus]|nr:hypothetical protein BDQ17DRAFT_1547031 [Cyathus striatus]